MHIPDGYLSPASCAALYAGAAPFWYLALRRIGKTLTDRMIPLLSMFAAFAFVVMMFNLPLPGGTTGHAVGIAVCAIVLGPWGSILAISTALLIQAVFFGDGGITTLGANCFNMAIAGSIVAYGAYRLLARRAPLHSARRVLAAGVAGYAAINVSGLCAAIEFGLQPRFFHDASGAPLYAPYPLQIAVPAMMLGHLTFAGLVEAVLSAGVVAYLQYSNPALLRLTAPDCAGTEPASSQVPHAGAVSPETSTPVERTPGFQISASVANGPLWHPPRGLWMGLATLLLLTPLGIRAAGTAWGEWSVEDFQQAQGRQAIATASHQSPPPQAPQGMQRLANFWTAPFPDYAPRFIRHPDFGYLLSGLFGAGLLVLGGLIAARIAARRGPRSLARENFLSRSLRGFVAALAHALEAEELAHGPGLLQQLDPRVKLVGLLALVVATAASRSLRIIAGVFVFAVLLAALSRIPLRRLALGLWAGVLAFTGVIAIPAIFLTPGQVLTRLPVVGWPITAQGCRSALFLVTRAETAATLALLLVLCTPWNDVLKAMRCLRVPATLVVIFGMTYRYIFLLLGTARDMFESRRSRTVGSLSGTERRQLATATAGVLLSKSLQLSQDVYLAMQSRGFTGEAYVLSDFAMKRRDYAGLLVLFGLAVVVFWLGR